MNTFETEFVGTDGLALPFFRGCFYRQAGVFAHCAGAQPEGVGRLGGACVRNPIAGASG